jgi:hypothetical protein
MIHQDLAPVGDTYWVQRQNAPTPTSGTIVTINDVSPTADRYNLAIVEVLPASASGSTYTISGSITPATNGLGATMTLTHNTTVITSVAADTAPIPLHPAKSGFTFSPTSQSVT